MMETSYSWLKDFDYSVRLVLSSESLSGLRQPVVLLKFDCKQPDGTINEKIIELDHSELNELLDTLKAAQIAVQAAK